MKCIYCQGDMERKSAPFQVDRKGHRLTIDAVPAWVCAQCGEPYFEVQEVESIQDVIREVDQRTEKLAAVH